MLLGYIFKCAIGSAVSNPTLTVCACVRVRVRVCVCGGEVENTHGGGVWTEGRGRLEESSETAPQERGRTAEKSRPYGSSSQRRSGPVRGSRQHDSALLPGEFLGE